MFEIVADFIHWLKVLQSNVADPSEEFDLNAFLEVGKQFDSTYRIPKSTLPKREPASIVFVKGEAVLRVQKMEEQPKPPPPPSLPLQPSTSAKRPATSVSREIEIIYISENFDLK